MSEDRLLEIYRQLRTSQEKYIYFMLAGAASAIAYALNRAQDKPLTLLLIPWGLALVLWGLSFFCGCRYLMYSMSMLYSDATMIQIKNGEHPAIGTNFKLAQAASEGIREALSDNIKKAKRLALLEIWFFIGGILAYVVWQLLEMYIRTN
jgi:hypothetical protein